MDLNLVGAVDTAAFSEFQLEIKEQADRRRTFAIISHPDAGKTTMTEKLLLYGGAIEEAGAVRSRRSQRQATSDWMELERQRGISITSTVLQFEYGKHCLNLLDTPGHHDFSEDTYRTLAAADNAVMLVDAAKGLEPQTRKLFKVCRLRKLPIFTFINKLDRPSREPMVLLDEIEKEFGISTYAVNWPVGTGDQFKGVVDRKTREVRLFERSAGGRTMASVKKFDLDSEELKQHISNTLYQQLREELDVLDGAGHKLDFDLLRSGEMSPVYFGSAMNNFGVEHFLQSFVDLSCPPGAMQSDVGVIKPTYPEFTGFVFKLQANMDPKHRDRIAFVRVCSGIFVKQMTVRNTRTGNLVTLSQPKKLFARERESIDEAYPGDIIGLSNPGAFAIGDTICSGARIRFPGIPSFSPELFGFLQNKEPSKYKQFHKGITALQDEGAIQIFWLKERETRYPLLAAVGPLQFDVVKFRMETEYGVRTGIQMFDIKEVRWVKGGWNSLKAVNNRSGVSVASDKFDDPVLLFTGKWDLDHFGDMYPSVELSSVDARSVEALREVL